MNTMVLVLLAAVAFLAFCVWYKKNKKKDNSSNGKLYVKLVSQKNGDRIWQVSFQSVEEIKAWWERREDLWEGVEKVELATEPKTRSLWQ